MWEDGRMRAQLARRRPDEGAGPVPGEPARAPEALSAVLALQRSAGNRAVAGVLSRAPDLASLFAPSSHTPAGRKRLVTELGPEDAARAWLQLRDGSGVDLPGGSFLIEPDERAELLPLLYERKEGFFVDFADGRRPLYAAMQAAADPTQRH